MHTLVCSIHLHIFIYTCIDTSSAHMNIYTYSCMCTHTYIFVYEQHIICSYTHTYIYTHTSIQTLHTYIHSSAIHKQQQIFGPFDRWAGVNHSSKSEEYVASKNQKLQMHYFPFLVVGGNG